MASKLLWTEVDNDLRSLAELGANSALRHTECAIIYSMLAHDPYYGVGSIYHRSEFFMRIGQLAQKSSVIRQLRAALLRALPMRWKTQHLQRIPGRIKESYQRAQLMYPSLMPNSRVKGSSPCGPDHHGVHEGIL